MATCFMRISKIKSNTQFYGKEAHNLRNGFVPNADISRSHLNETLVDAGTSFYNFYKNRINSSEYYKTNKVRANAIRGFEVMLTYGKEKDEKMPKDFDFDEWKQKNVEWLEETFGKENVASVVLHMDEVTPHIHAIVVPMVDDKLNGSYYTKTRKKLHELQNSYGEKMQPLGLKRGMQHSRAKHTDIMKFYDDLNNALEYTLPDMKKGEKPEDYVKRANEYVRELNIRHFRDLKDLERKYVKEQTISLQDKLDFYEEKRQFEQEKQAFAKEKSYAQQIKEEFEREMGCTFEEAQKDLIYVKKLKEAINEYPDKEYSDAIVAGLQEIERYCDEKKKKRKKEKDFVYEEDRYQPILN